MTTGKWVMAVIAVLILGIGILFFWKNYVIAPKSVLASSESMKRELDSTKALLKLCRETKPIIVHDTEYKPKPFYVYRDTGSTHWFQVPVDTSSYPFFCFEVRNIIDTLKNDSNLTCINKMTLWANDLQERTTSFDFHFKPTIYPPIPIKKKPHYINAELSYNNILELGTGLGYVTRSGWGFGGKVYPIRKPLVFEGKVTYQILLP